MERARTAKLLLITSILYVLAFYFIGSAIKPGYSQLSSFVSEYNATGTAWAGALTYGGFLATSVLFSGFLLAAAPVLQLCGVSRTGLWLLWSIPLSYFLSVIAPCDAGCPTTGSASQQAHNLLAIVAYVGMGAGVALVSLAPGFDAYKARRAFLLLTGAAFPVFFYIMVQPELAQWRGLIQRMLDVAMAICLVMLLWTILPEERRTGE